jgi:hypothetical protein
MAEDASSLWIGGGLALAGTALGLVGSLVTGWLERKNQRHRLLRERYEELTACIAAIGPWLHRLGSCRSLDEVKQVHPPLELRRMVILSLIYFPELKQAVALYNNACIQHFHRAVDACGHRWDGIASVGAIIAKMMNEKGEKDTMQELRHILDLEIETHAEKYTKA